MRIRWVAAWAGLGMGTAFGLGFFEIETAIPRGGEKAPATLTLVFPDSLSGTDLRVLLLAPANAKTLLPAGRLGASEADFLEGLRAFAAGRTGEAAMAWSRLRGRRLDPELRSCWQVNTALLGALRGEIQEAESLWAKEWDAGAPAAEGAWRNLLGIRLAGRRFAQAQALLDRVLRNEPRQRFALLAKLGLLLQLRPDSEIEAYLKKQASGKMALPEMQAAYGEFLAERGRWVEALPLLEKSLSARSGNGRGWRLLAEGQHRLGYHLFALDCLENAYRAGYRESDLYELFARALRACCMAVEDARALRAREAAERLLEEGLPKDLHRRSMAQLLYHVYCQNRKPEAARRLQEDLWFHFQGPPPAVPELGIGAWPRVPSGALELRLGLYSFDWVKALRDGDFYRAF